MNISGQSDRSGEEYEKREAWKKGGVVEEAAGGGYQTGVVEA